MYPFVDSSLHAVCFEFPVGIQTHVLCAKKFYAIKQYMQLSVLTFVALIVMHMYVGTSDLH